MKLAHAVLAVGGTALTLVLAGPARAQEPAKPMAASHDLAGREQCLMCHSGAMQGVPGVPDSHEGRPNAVCAWCHAPNAVMLTKTPPALPHATQGREQCRMCHSGAMQGVPAPPADHEGRDVQYCSLCHKPQG